MDDTVFIALTSYLDAILWTGDKKLTKEISRSEYIHCVSTNQLIEFRDLLSQ